MNNDNGKKKALKIAIILLIIVIIILLLLRACDVIGKGSKGSGKGSSDKNPKETVQQDEKKTDIGGTTGGTTGGGGSKPTPSPTPTPPTPTPEPVVVYPTALSGLVYNTKAQTLIVPGTAEGGDAGHFVYSFDTEAAYSFEIPQKTDAGKYIVYWRYIKNGNVADHGNLLTSIAKAKDKGTVTVATGLVDNDEPHDLITSASSSFGADFEYSLDGSDYSKDIPQATEAGTYNIAWRTEGTDNYDADSGTCTATIAPKPVPVITIEFNDKLTYNGLDQMLIKSASATEDAVIEYSFDDNDWTTDVTTITGQNAGSYKIYYRIVETSAYAGVASTSKSLTIAKAKDVATVTAAEGLVEDDSKHDLITASSSSLHADFMYSLDGSSWSEEIPYAVKAGNYKVYWKTVGTDNFDGDSGTCDEIIIAAKPAPVYEIAFNDALTYNGKAQQLVKSATAAEGVTIEYCAVLGKASLEESDWTTDSSKITATNADNYVVYYRIKETSAHAGVMSSGTAKISKASLSSIVFVPQPTFKYDQGTKSVTLTVYAGTVGNLVEVDASEYQVSGTTSASAIDTYSVTATANANSTNFTGSVTDKWAILDSYVFGNGALTIQGSDQQYTVESASYTYSGSAITPLYKVYADAKTLAEGTEYVVVQADSVLSATDAGTYTIKVKGQGNYAESNVAVAKWTIAPAALGQVSAEYTSIECTGEKLVPKITVKNQAGTVTLEENKDYKLTFYVKNGQGNYEEIAAPTDPGSYKAKVSGIGNYTGDDETVKWTITENYICKIGSKSYTSIEKAIEAVPTDGTPTTVTMLKSVEGATGITVPSGKNVIIDFKNGGKTFSLTFAPGSTGEESVGFSITDGASLTLKNGTISCTAANKTARWTSADTVKGISTLIKAHGDLTLDNCTVDGTNLALNGKTKLSTGTIEAVGGDVSLQTGATVNGQLRVGTDANVGAATSGSTVSIATGATVNKPALVGDTLESAILVFGDNSLNVAGEVNGRISTDKTDGNGGSKIKVSTGAAITEDSDVGILMESGSLTVVGGTIEGKTAVYFKSKEEILITGGYLTGIGEAQSYSYKTSGCNPTGDALVVDNCSSAVKMGDPLVTGGYYKSVNGKTIGSYYGNGVTPSEKKLAFVTGGYYTDSVAEMLASGLIAEDYWAFATENEYYPTMVDEKEGRVYTITTGSYAYDEDNQLITDIATTPTMNPADGILIAGESITLTASQKSLTYQDVNYRLDGWAIKDGNTYTSISNDAAQSFTYTPGSTATIVARYKIIPTVYYGLTVTADAFTVEANGVTDSGTVTKDYQFAEGTTVKVTYTYTGTDKIFTSWKNNTSNIIVSTEKTYTFTLGSKTTIEALTDTPVEETRIVEFVSANNQLLQRVTVTEATVKDLTLPNAPPKSGYNYSGSWSVKDGTTELGTVTNTAGLIALINKNFDTADSFTVVPLYTKSEDKIVLTIIHVPDGLPEKVITEELEVTKGATVTVRAYDKLEDMAFNFWTSDAAGTTKIGYSGSINVYGDADKTIYAQYSNNEVTKLPTASISSTEKLIMTNINGIRLTLSWNVPEGYELIEQGVVYSVSDEAVEDDLTTENVDNGGVKGAAKKTGKSTAATGTANYNFNQTGIEDQVVKARGYIIFKISGEPDTYRLYTGEYFCKSWNQM